MTQFEPVGSSFGTFAGRLVVDTVVDILGSTRKLESGSTAQGVRAQ